MRDGSYPRSRRTPSFSSSLLDAIYRSTDQSKSDLDEDSQLGLCKEVHHTKQSNMSRSGGVSLGNEYGKVRDVKHLRRSTFMVEDWMEKQSSHSSSECSSGGFFSSSETETSCKQRSRPKSDKRLNSEKQKKQKVKQPMSPGSRIASFLSSIFNYGSVKKAKMCYVGAVEDVNFEQKCQSPCVSSSASSYSRRSCMSKTPSWAKKNNGVKRSVKFYPVNIILGEDSQHKFVCQNDPDIMPFPGSAGKITRNSSTKEDEKKKQKKKNSVMAKENGSRKGEFDFRLLYNHNGEEEEEDDDDALSCSSSDLFELDHLIGGGRRYQEELPVYETTNLETNKAIANGLRL
ncbi:protein BIG GRAIN 1-like C [Neltuma alba]|uniref:protein BIG GRAIN 1-like C n=1 Tax=Neltuma alba TaxID=207710 RepID=UPI0010A4A0A9|nr:protein BIG GRAIN 1-like C [Prosopis alba]